MRTRIPFDTWSIGRKLAYGYAAAGVILLIVMALRSSSVEAWLWRLLGFFVAGGISLRFALVFAYRKKLSKLDWLLRPTPGEGNEFAAMWFVYAVIFGAAALLLAIA